MITFLNAIWLWTEHLTRRLLGAITLSNLLRIWVRLFLLGLLGIVLPVAVLFWATTGHVEWVPIRFAIGAVFFLSATLIMGPALKLAGVREARLTWLGIGILIVILALLSMVANDYLAAPFNRITIIGLAVLFLLILWGGGEGRRLSWWLIAIPFLLVVIGVVGGLYKNPKVREEARRVGLPDVAIEFERQNGDAGDAGAVLPREWSESITLQPGRSRVLDPLSLTCGSRYDDRLVYVGDPVGGGCIEVYADGKKYMNCPETYVDIPRKARDWVLRNRTSKTLVVSVSVTSANDC